MKIINLPHKGLTVVSVKYRKYNSHTSPLGIRFIFTITEVISKDWRVINEDKWVVAEEVI